MDGNFNTAESNLYASYGDKHIFVNGEDTGLNIVQGGNLQFGSGHKEGLGNCTSIGGGSLNTGSSASSFIGAGNCNNVSGSGQYAFIGAGFKNSVQTSTNGGSAIVAGCLNLINDTGTGCGNNFIGAGTDNCSTGGCSAVVAGSSNSANGNRSFVGGGGSNNASAQYSGVASGLSNCAQGTYAFVGGGFSNNASSFASTIGGGYNNTANAGCSFIGGGKNNTIVATDSSILGGYCNRICTNGGCGAILSGCQNVVCHQFSTIIGGCNITTTTTNTAYALNMTVKTHLQVGGTTTLSSTTGRIDATNDVVAFSTSDRRLKC